jgi:hypothetical protein
VERIELYRTSFGKYILVEPNDNTEIAIQVLELMGIGRTQPFNFIRITKEVDTFTELCRMLDYEVVVINENGVWRSDYI